MWVGHPEELPLLHPGIGTVLDLPMNEALKLPQTKVKFSFQVFLPGHPGKDRAPAVHSALILALPGNQACSWEHLIICLAGRHRPGLGGGEWRIGGSVQRPGSTQLKYEAGQKSAPGGGHHMDKRWDELSSLRSQEEAGGAARGKKKGESSVGSRGQVSLIFFFNAP